MKTSLTAPSMYVQYQQKQILDAINGVKTPSTTPASAIDARHTMVPSNGTPSLEGSLSSLHNLLPSSSTTSSSHSLQNGIKKTKNSPPAMLKLLSGPTSEGTSSAKLSGILPCPPRPHPSPSGRTDEADDESSESSGSVTLHGEDTEQEQNEVQSVRRASVQHGELHALSQMQQARAHWIQLHKMNMQLPVLHRMFLRLLQRHPPFRALWPFARNFADGTLNNEMASSACFQHFCAAYQATLTMVMDNLDDEPVLCRLLQELGSNHFFYDATEVHFKMMREEFVQALVECVDGTNEEMDDELADDWDQLWSKMESNMALGLVVQRHNYLAHCVIGTEMQKVRAQWKALMNRVHKGMMSAKIEKRSCGTFIEEMQRNIGMDLLWSEDELVTRFGRTVHDLLWTMDKAISLWEPGIGFLRLRAELDGKCGDANEMIRKGSAAIMRKAFIEGLGAELASVFGEEEADDATAMHIWTKIYRVAEQAILADDALGQ